MPVSLGLHFATINIHSTHAFIEGPGFEVFAQLKKPSESVDHFDYPRPFMGKAKNPACGTLTFLFGPLVVMLWRRTNTAPQPLS